MSRIALAVAATFATLFLGAQNARVEDTAAILAAMPDRAAEQRYLTKLCDRVGVAEQKLFAAMDGVVACKQGGCAYRDVDKAIAFEDAAQRVHASSFGAYAEAASAYRAKRAMSPPSHARSPATQQAPPDALCDAAVQAEYERRPGARIRR